MAKTNNYLLIALAICCVAVAVGTSASAAKLTCADVQRSMMPCMTYLMTPGAKPDSKCCSGVKGLVNLASTPTDRQNACNCLKTAAGRIKKIVPANAAKLPSSCGANIPYKISPSTNCNTIN